LVSVTVEARFTAEIVKVAPEQRRFFGWAYITKRSDGSQVVDHSGDAIDTPEARAALEDAFHRYVRDSGAGDDQHELFNASKLIEAVALTREKASAMGIPDDAALPEGLWVGFEVAQTPAGDALWERVKKRERSMLSIVGRGFTL
jgi:hypothetical protein